MEKPKIWPLDTLKPIDPKICIGDYVLDISPVQNFVQIRQGVFLAIWVKYNS